MNNGEIVGLSLGSILPSHVLLVEGISDQTLKLAQGVCEILHWIAYLIIDSNFRPADRR
jgi:hypothetical protein